MRKQKINYWKKKNSNKMIIKNFNKYPIIKTMIININKLNN